MMQHQVLSNIEIGCFGFCRQCRREHRLPVGPAHQACLSLMDELESGCRIDQYLRAEQADPRFSTSYLFGAARGKMFGVMVAMAPDGERVVLRAFSGQYNGVWKVPGWAGPVFDQNAFHLVHDGKERKIKELGRQIDQQVVGSLQKLELIALRKKMSQQLMANIHTLYRLKNFSGQVALLQEIFLPDMGIPTGTGDCCAPKLLQYAAEHGLVPLGMAEFYWGRANASGSRQHGRFYSSCRTKCYPILGFMLCGLKEESWDG
jgi:hypothetical protein